jgi:hypothetical protein
VKKKKVKNERRKFGKRKALIFAVLLITLAFVSVSVGTASAATVSGHITAPDADFGWTLGAHEYSILNVRVEGTDISSSVNGSGFFTLSNVPTGQVTLIVDELETDYFQQQSKRKTVTTTSEGLSNVIIELDWHWHELAGYPPNWGETGYGEWTPHFVSEEVGFIFFRVRGEGIDPERMELYRTLDGGITWEEIGHWEQGDAFYLGGHIFYFCDQNHGVVQAMIDTNPDPDRTTYITRGVLFTSDGGETWSYSDFPNPPDSQASSSIGIHRFTQINNNHWIAAGQNGGTGSYGFPGFDIIWETTDSGATWELKTYWQQDYGECTGLGANSYGRAIAFFTPYHVGAERRFALREESGDWTVTWNDSIVTNSGYGAADVPMVGDTSWVANSGQGSLPQGLYQSNDACLSWTKISDASVQYMDFASLDKGFGLFGGPAYITYDGGKNWLLQAGGGGLCCGGNHIWAFDTTHAIWHEGGAGDPNGKGQIFTYVEPWEVNFEAVSGVSIKDSYVGSRAANVPMSSYKLLNHGPVPIMVNALDCWASGSGDDKADVSEVNLWRDANANGYKDDSDTFLGSGTYAKDNGSVHFSFSDILLKQYVPVHLLVTYDFGDNLIPGKTYFCSVKAEDIQAKIQGTGTPISPTAPLDYPLVTRQMTAGKTIFSDNFESGLGNWIPDSAYYSWQLTENASVSPTHSVYVWDDRGHEHYGGNNCLTLKQSLYLSEDGNYSLTFWHNYRLDPSFQLWVEVSTDGGTSWKWIDRYGSYDTWDGYSTGDFVQEVIDLNEYAGQDPVIIRFRFDWTAGWYYYGIWYIDDVQLFDISAPKPIISIYTDKTSYTTGDRMHLGLDVKNPTDSAQRVSPSIYLELPTGGTFTLIDTTVTLPAGLDYCNPNFKVFPLPTIPTGTYTWHAILGDPVTGAIISESEAEWDFVGVGIEKPIETEDITKIFPPITGKIEFED